MRMARRTATRWRMPPDSSDTAWFHSPKGRVPPSPPRDDGSFFFLFQTCGALPRAGYWLQLSVLLPAAVPEKPYFFLRLPVPRFSAVRLLQACQNPQQGCLSRPGRSHQTGHCSFFSSIVRFEKITCSPYAFFRWQISIVSSLISSPASFFLQDPFLLKQLFRDRS